MKNYLLLLFCLSISFNKVNAQCYADGCIDDAANTTPVPGCCTATTTGMTTSINYSISGCADFTGGQDVYLTFLAPSSGYLNIDFTTISIAGTVNMVVFDSWSNADNCATLNAGGVVAACESFDASTPPNPISLNYVVAGERYFIVVSTPPGSTPGDFEVCLSITLPIGGMDCTGGTVLCDKSTQVVSNITAGGGSISGDCTMEDVSTAGGTSPCGIAGSCWGAGAGDGGGEVNSQWYTFTCSQSGTLTMALKPNNTSMFCGNMGGCSGGCASGDDYDYMLIDITKTAYPYFTCNINGSDFGGSDSATVMSCNWSGARGVIGFGAAGPQSFGYVGTGSDFGGCTTTADFVGNTTTAWSYSDVNVVCGKTYALIVSNYSGASTAGFTLSWGGTALFGVQPATITTPTLTGTYCDVSSTLTSPLCSGSLISTYTYSVDWGDGITSTPSSTSLSHSYAEQGTYNVTYSVSDPVGCVKGFSESITISCSGLPVGVSSFTAENRIIYNELKWVTQSETNNDHFIIERSINGIEWNALSLLEGAGNSSHTIHYRYEDKDFENVINYYRLKQVDYDGTISYLNPVKVDNTLPEGEIVQIVIHDLLGKEITEITEPGIYVLNITYENGKTEIQKISR